MRDGKVARVETPSGATTETTNAAPGASSSAPGAESPPAAKGPGEQARIDELTSNWRNEQRNTEHFRTRTQQLERELEAARATRAQNREAGAEDGGTEGDDEEIKTLADFKYDEKAYGKYIRDLARTESQRETEKLRSEWKGERTEAERKAQVGEFQTKALEWAKGQKLENPEQMFKPPEQGGPYVSPLMADAIMTSEHGWPILNYLARNVAESRRICALTPAQQGREIGRLEAKFASPPTPPQVSDAPPPHETVKGAAGSKEATDPAKQTDNEWWASRQRSDRARRAAQAKK